MTLVSPRLIRCLLVECVQANVYKMMQSTMAAATPTRCSALTNWVKINTDTTFFMASARTKIGMVLRDSYDSFVRAKSMMIPGCIDVDVERLGVLWKRYHGLLK